LYPRNAMMTTYTYSPLIGMTSQCGYDNKISYYEYDAFNRLTLIRDQDNKILKKICYNYSTGQQENCTGALIYNDQISIPFTRNNCGFGFVGTTVNYIVPANTYSSWISKQIANQLALDDVNLNGQNFANQNANCIALPPCTNVVCTTSGEKCINGTCELGIKVFTASENQGGTWLCTYHYEYSDGSWSDDYTQLSGSTCL
jgi:hypothetical protein